MSLGASVGKRFEHRLKGGVLLVANVREEAVGEGASSSGEEAIQGFLLGGPGESQGGEEAVADDGVARVVVEVVGVEVRGPGNLPGRRAGPGE
ncbi:hypothetical protein AB0M42_21490 [Streptomyces sp. NPDC051784]|uniref:hypothetical protein n=1 Tax=Streptomyces sp. NPDC051784 TaxID=3155805 RepID=UPI00341C6908